VSKPAEQPVAKAEFISPYLGDGWPYKVEKKDEAVGPGEATTYWDARRLAKFWRNRCIFE
jgi:hypothetical protein